MRAVRKPRQPTLPLDLCSATDKRCCYSLDLLGILEGFVKERCLPEINMFKRNYKNFYEAEFEEMVIKGIDWNENRLECMKLIF